MITLKFTALFGNKLKKEHKTHLKYLKFSSSIITLEILTVNQLGTSILGCREFKFVQTED